MSGPAQFILRGRLPATVTGAIGAFVPPFFLLSAAGISLVALRKGLSEALITVGLCSVVAAVLGAATAGSPLAGAVYGATLLPCVYLAEVLRRFVSLRVAIVSSVALTTLAIVGLYLAVADPAVFWQERMLDAINDWKANGAPADMLEELGRLAEVFPYEAATGMLLAGMLLTYLGGLFIGRAWQAGAYNPGGFAKEFQALQLGRGMAVASCVCFILSGIQAGSLFLNLAVVLLMVWLIQGLAIIHAVAAVMKVHWIGLAAIYAALVAGWWTGNAIVLLVPLLGIISQFIDLRQLLAKKN